MGQLASVGFTSSCRDSVSVGDVSSVVVVYVRQGRTWEWTGGCQSDRGAQYNDLSCSTHSLLTFEGLVCLFCVGCCRCW